MKVKVCDALCGAGKTVSCINMMNSDTEHKYIFATPYLNEVTVFQLYDQFFQYGYLRAMDLSEMAYSNHGGKDFDLQAWLKPITNLEKEQK